MARSASYDPLEKFRFIVSWSNTGDSEATTIARAGFHDIQMPKRTTTKGTYREGNDRDIPQLHAGLSQMEDVVMSRGIISMTDAQSSDLYSWMSAVHAPSAGDSGASKKGGTSTRPAAAASNKYKKDVTITMLDREGNSARTWVLYNAFPVNFVPGSDLSADDDTEKSMESVTLAYEDFQEVDSTMKAK